MTSASEYKRRCGEPNVLRRGVIERTAQGVRGLSPSVALLLRGQLKATPVPKPPLHRGGKETDYLELSLTHSEVDSVVVALFAEMLRCRVEGELVPHQEAMLLDLYQEWEPYWLGLGDR